MVMSVRIMLMMMMVMLVKLVMIMVFAKGMFFFSSCSKWTHTELQSKKHSGDQFAATFLDSIPQFALTRGIQDFHVTER